MSNSAAGEIMPKVAVVGCGYWGTNLVRNHHELGSLWAICDTNQDVLDGFAGKYSEVLCVANYQQLLEKSELDAVVLAAPAAMHFSLAREALTAGKDVFVEKPLALDVAEAEELSALAAEKGRVLMVGHLLQYHPAFIKLKELVSHGELGRINYIYSNRLSFGKIRREEDILWSFAPHDISMILSLAKDLPESVSAIGGNYLHKKIADVTTTHLDFASGLKAHVFVSWLHPFKEQKLVVVGDKSMAVFNDTLPWDEKLQLYPHDIDWDNGIPVPHKKDAVRIELRESEPLRDECLYFLDCVLERKKPVTDSLEGVSVLKVLRASQESLEKDGERIYLQAELHAKPDYFIHETAAVDNNVSIGHDTKIWHFSHILGNSTIGDNCNIGQNVVVGPDVVIGRNCKIQNNVSVYRGVTLEDGVFCGPSMVFTNIYNPRAEIAKMDQVRPTLVKKGATIGANATIVCGVILGEYSFIGAGAVVTRDVPAHALMVGNPARQIGWVCRCGERLDGNMRCLQCSNQYNDLV